jgi:hypothetical protein
MSRTHTWILRKIKWHVCGPNISISLPFLSHTVWKQQQQLVRTLKIVNYLFSRWKSRSYFCHISQTLLIILDFIYHNFSLVSYLRFLLVSFVLLTDWCLWNHLEVCFERLINLLFCLRLINSCAPDYICICHHDKYDNYYIR